jgi:hypothetical protein
VGNTKLLGKGVVPRNKVGRSKGFAQLMNVEFAFGKGGGQAGVPAKGGRECGVIHTY